MAAAKAKMDQARLESAWIAMFCSALSGYQPVPSVLEDDAESDKQVDKRDASYAEDALAYAELVADGGLETFVEKFGGPERSRARSGRRASSRDEEE